MQKEFQFSSLSKLMSESGACPGILKGGAQSKAMPAGPDLDYERPV